jgi:2-furoyl-CoA dehydrogenase large subunit
MPKFAMPEEVREGDTHVGRRLLRVEDRSLLRGEGQFVDDVPVKKGTLQAAFLRSPHAHAEIVSIDTSEAEKLPGVFAVLTGREVAEQTDPLIVGFENPIDYYGIAVDKVRYVGEPVVAVAAMDRYRAEDALDLIKVTYNVLPAAVDPVDAVAEEAPILHPRSQSNCVSKRNFVHGEPDKAFAEAEHTTELTIRYPRNSITPMETYAVVSEHNEETGGFDVLSNFQGPFSVHTVMALALRVRTAALRHRSPKNSGGSFGSKLVIFPYIVVLCVLARKARKPVKWIEDRLEHLSASSVAPNRVTKVEAAYGSDGIVSGLRLTHWDDHGAYLRAPMPAPIYRMHGVSTNGYNIRNLEVTNHIVMTNKCPTGAVRGFGGPQLYFAVERAMHKIATELGIDPLDMMRRNMIKAEQFPYKAIAGALLDSGDYLKTIEETVSEGGLEALRKRRDEARAQGKLYGIGYAACVEPSQSNMGYISTLKTGVERERAGPKDGAVASVTVSVDALGSVNVIGDSVPQGQGHQTALSQIVADQLGLDPNDIVVSLDTDTAKDGWSIAAGNYSCRFAPASASAAHQAAFRVREKMARIAASRLNVPPREIEFSDGKIHAASNKENAIPFYRVGGLAHWSPSSLPDDVEPGIRETSMWNAPELTPTTANDEINTSLAYGFGFDFCGVEIDRDTGVVRVDHYVSAHDCGTILNPGLAEGQIKGSWASAWGATFLEEFCYDNDGTFRSGSFAEYLVPTAAELPDFQLVHPTPHPSPYTRLGAKGIAEGNQYTTPVCVANAVADALGIEDVQLPLKPAKVLQWIGATEPPPSQGSETATTLTGKSSAIDGNGQMDVPAPAQAVWDLLLDPEQMARLIPGCERLEVLGDGRFIGVVMLGVGPVKGRFDVNIELTDLEEPHRATLSGTADGPLGSSRGRGSFTLEASDTGSTVSYEYSVELSGKVAAVGGRMIQGAARQLIDRFMRSLVIQAGGGTQPVQERQPFSLFAWLRRLFGGSQ